MTFPVEFTLGSETHRERASTLGGGGIFMACQRPPAQGSEITIRFRPAKHLPVVSAKAKICYVVPQQGFAVEFTDISPEHRQILLRLILHKTGGDKRTAPRAPLTAQIECQECTSLAFSRDVSQGGMFIETKKPPAVGVLVNVRFNLDDGGPIVIARAEVLYQVVKLGAGIRFTDISAEDRKRIESYVTRNGPSELITQTAAS